ncbi:hypothetical protein AAFF_G00256920 [Aldrovandia affinis]|uniref:Uncharacterized protein n=1 Tax=Aldrovandia affinis TaxID=143900 RepID=A0AAD7ST74_9TELE|nr:hypothetical protein AAFF_G00256920 [Aldrovandia affinis]
MSNAQAATGSPRCSAMPREWCPAPAALTSCASPEEESASSLKVVPLGKSPTDHFCQSKLKIHLYPIFQCPSPAWDQLVARMSFGRD